MLHMSGVTSLDVRDGRSCKEGGNSMTLQDRRQRGLALKTARAQLSLNLQGPVNKVLYKEEEGGSGAATGLN